MTTNRRICRQDLAMNFFSRSIRAGAALTAIGSINPNSSPREIRGITGEKSGWTRTLADFAHLEQIVRIRDREGFYKNLVHVLDGLDHEFFFD
jgi:hypothetical protein